MKYTNYIKRGLGISMQVIKLDKLFLEFVQKHSCDISNETRFLTTIKRFLILKEKDVRRLNYGTKLSAYDCLTLAIIASCLAVRHGYDVKIGRPDLLSRYYHSVLITSDNKMFKLTGKRRDYGFKEIKPQTVVTRIKFLNPIMAFFDFILLKHPH